MSTLDFIYRRRSVRKFKADPVPEDDIRELLKAATWAPSGKNLQNWHFVVITDARKIAEIARLVEDKNAKLAEYLTDEAKIKTFRGSVPYHTVFKGAPVLILIYASPYESIADLLTEAGILPQAEALRYGRPNPGIQNIAAATENLLLAAASLGYGTCWMTGPTYAAEEISACIGFAKPGFHLAAMTPLGVPAESAGANPPRKPLDEVVTFIR